MSLTKSLSLVALATGLLLLIPLTAMQFTSEVNWTFLDFAFAGILLFGTGATYVLIARRWNNTAYRLGVGVGVLAGLLLVWANAAVGLVGSEANDANMLYASVLLVALGGAIIARFRPLGMSNAMFAAAFTYVLVTIVAVFVWQPSPDTAETSVRLTTVLVFNAFFAALWVVSGLLFRRAGSSTANLTQRLA